MAISAQKVQEIIKLKVDDEKIRQQGGKGKSNCQIAEEVLGSRSAESSVRRIFKEYKKSGAYRGVGGGGVDTSEEFKIDMLSDSFLEHAINCDDEGYANLAKRLRTAQRTNNQLRKIHRGAVDSGNTESLSDVFKVLSDNLEGKFYTYEKPTKPCSTLNKTVEILFSDLQIGKISESWNTPTAIKTLKYYGQELLRIVEEAKPERIIFASLGDIIEDAIKHKIQSAISTDTGNAEQMANAIEHVWWSVLAPLINTGIPMEIVGVQGNHGSSENKGMDMFKAGKYGYDYTIYKTWENMCKLIKADHVTFNLPEGHFATYRIYGKLTVAEHGYSCKGTSENAMLTLRNKRSTNLQEYVHRLVIGDMHHYCNYDNGNLQVNGAFFGVAFDAIEYSGIMGFHAVPAQVVNIHEPVTGVGQNTVVETKVIQVAKGY